jgi:DNA-binding MarR family transcriptional regulator
LLEFIVSPLNYLLGNRLLSDEIWHKKGELTKMDEAMVKRIILLAIENDALNNVVYEQKVQKKIISKFQELSKNEPRVIRIIGMEGEIMPSTIGNYTGMEKSSLTHMVDDLEKKGMVFRKKDPKDRRKMLVSLTDKGLDCYNYISKTTDEFFNSLDEKDVEDYVQSLETMVRILRKTANQRI